jgi:hypothetical protein
MQGLENLLYFIQTIAIGLLVLMPIILVVILSITIKNNRR